MALPKQTLSLPIIGGLNEKDDALLSNRPQQMTNCLYRKTGSVSKRYGYECVGKYNLRSDGTTPAEGENLTTYGDELVRIGGGKLDTYQTLNSTSDWVYRGRVSEVSVETLRVATAEAGVLACDPSIAYANGFLIIAYLSSRTGSYRLLIDVINASTGARIYSGYVVRTLVSASSNPKVIAGGTMALVSWVESAEIKAQFLDLTTMVWGTRSVVTPGVTLANAYFDCAYLSATAWVFAYEVTTGATRIKTHSINSTISGGAFDSTNSANLSGSSGSTCMAVRVDSANSKIWFAYATQSGSVWNAYVQVLSTAFASVLTQTTLATSGTADIVRSIGIETLSSTKAIIVWTVQDDVEDFSHTYWNEITTAAVISYSPDRVVNHMWMLSRPFLANGRAMVLLGNVHGTHTTQFIVDLFASETMATGVTPRIAAVVLPRQLGPVVGDGTTYPRQYGAVSDVVAVSSTNLWIVSLTGLDPVGSGDFGVIGLNVLVNDEWKRTAAQAANSLIIGGGVLSAYDGSSTFEVGYAYEPDVSQLSPFESSAGAGLEASKSYSYKFVFAWKDSRGNVYRSIPSIAVSAATGASDCRIDLEIPHLHLTNKITSADPNSPVYVEMYRTEANGSEYFFHSRIVNVPNSAPTAYTDSTADAVISNNESLYTTGGVLDHVIPAGGSLVMAWKGGLLVAGTEDDSIWVSGEILDGEGPWFNDTLNISPFEGGRMSALGLLDDTPILFKQDAAFYIQGEPPSDLGVSTIGPPKRIQTDAGCTDAASVVMTHQGIARKARTGLYLLDRSLSDRPIGKNVEDSYRTDGFAGAAQLPSQGLVRWLQKGTSGADALNFDYYHTDVYGSPVWSKDVLKDVGYLSGSADPVACTVWQGAFVWLSSSGRLYSEKTTNYLDSSSGSDTWISATFEAGVEKAAGVAAYQRVRRVYVTGNRASTHNLTVTVTTDIGSEARTWTNAQIAASSGVPNEKLMMHLEYQKCRWIRVKVEDAAPTGDYGNGGGLTLRDITLELGVKPGGARVPAANRK